MTSTTADDLREKLRDELAGFPIGTGYYQTTVGTDEARDMADALLPIIEAHEAEVRAFSAENQDDLSDRSDLSGLVRAERILRDQEQHYAADSVAEAIRALDHWLEQVEKVEALADDITEDVERVLMLTPDAHGDRCEYGCGVALIEACARRAAEDIAERVTRRQENSDA